MYLPGGTWKFSKYLAALHVYKAHGNFHVPPWGHMEISKASTLRHCTCIRYMEIYTCIAARHMEISVYHPAWARGNYHVLSRITLPFYERVR